MEIIVNVNKQLARKGDWTFFRADLGEDGSGASVICKGNIPWEIQEQDVLSLRGDYRPYKGERHFVFQSVKVVLPLEERAQLHYVAERTSGIGPAMEQAIWDAKKEAWRDVTSSDVKKLTPAILEELKKQIKKMDADKEKAKTIAFLEDKGCTPNMAGAAWERWKEKTVGMVNSDCYCLATLSGFSFKTVDGKIRHAFGIADADPRRLKAAILYAMQQAGENGDTAISAYKHFDLMREILPEIGCSLIVETVHSLIEEGKLFLLGDFLATAENYSREKSIFEKVRKNIGRELTLKEFNEGAISEGEKFSPDETQVAAALHAIKNSFSIINGGAGAGKTTIIRMICRGIRMADEDPQIALCAPTGKAAARLKEASGIEATTIHVLLCCMGENVFSAGSLSGTTVIVDESSMVDSLLMAEILQRDPRRLILVGDQAQLVPVGAGQPFHDLIDLFPETVKTLTKCYRNTEAVFQQAVRIREGKAPAVNAESEKERWSFFFMTPEQAEETICRMTETGELDFTQDIVLTPKNGKKGEDGTFPPATVNSLNAAILAIDRQNRCISPLWEKKFAPGDRVINTINHAEKQIWNGTTGTVHEYDQEGKLWVNLDTPITNGEGEKISSVLLDKEEIGDLQYAYALSVHKSQGSQYRKVIMIVLQRDSFILDRSLIYTGVTRTRKECCIFGDYAALQNQIRQNRTKATIIPIIAKEEK